jgi:anti-sigma B factor antagonist
MYAEARMLSLNTRDIGRVTVVSCSGRIVVGQASDALRDHINHLLRDRRALILDLGEVGFIDSTGLGTMVRLLAATRQARGDLKLCAVPAPVRSLLKITTTQRLFDIHESEENAVAAFYKTGSASVAAPSVQGPHILCIHKSVDVLAYLRELLRNSGYDVQTTTGLGDAMMLLRVDRPKLILLGHDAIASPERKAALISACSNVPCISLSEDFSTQHAGEAAEGLLREIRSHVPAGPHSPSPPSA